MNLNNEAGVAESINRYLPESWARCPIYNADNIRALRGQVVGRVHVAADRTGYGALLGAAVELTCFLVQSTAFAGRGMNFEMGEAMRLTRVWSFFTWGRRDRLDIDFAVGHGANLSTVKATMVDRGNDLYGYDLFTWIDNQRHTVNQQQITLVLRREGQDWNAYLRN